MSAKPEIIRRLSSLKLRLEKRAAVFSAVREFFNSNAFIEVTTPVRIRAPAPEPHIVAVPSGDLFLRTSPELEMKCMLASGYGKIFQIGPCFRKNEKGRLHREEFTMLEWYEAGADYLKLIDFTRKLLEFISMKVHGSPRCVFRGCEIDFAKAEIITLKSAFAKFAKRNLLEIVADDKFEEVLVTDVEPALPKDRPVFVKDYPAKFAALSRLRKDDPEFAERWELYLGGVEIANAYSELVDGREQQERFRKAQAWKKYSGEGIYPENKDFTDVLGHGIPECAGCALGMDRLAMVIAGADSIDEIMA
ncbi:MAG TPA: EF-P lysine aminoacylase GenX [Lentisphaeria bacterium]|nr:MAG: EF-P lysine aminoacylase GenX [Lentisphaerae bacterium GWF2_49_21]HBC85398.1 EF-P lysine aminoacylase GenX [Lentisphaeria bacterium]